MVSEIGRQISIAMMSAPSLASRIAWAGLTACGPVEVDSPFQRAVEHRHHCSFRGLRTRCATGETMFLQRSRMIGHVMQ